MILALLVAGFTSMQATNRNHHNNNNNRHNNSYYQSSENDVPKEKLPKAVTKYLGKQYPGYQVMLSKQKEDGYFYVKIKYNNKSNRPYYRDLVFDQKGNTVRG